MSTRRKGKAQQARKVKRTSPRDGGGFTMFDGVCRDILATQGRDVLRSGEPIQAELWMSHVLGLFDSQRPICSVIGELDPAAAIGARLVSVARRTRTPEAQLCLRGLAAVAGGRLGQQANRVAREVTNPRTQAPDWIEAIGTAKPTVAWRATDPCGDQDSVMVGFVYPSGVEHSIVVLIDHPLGGIAKDAAVLGPLADVVATWRGRSDIEPVEEPIDVAATRVIEAVERTSHTIDAPITDDYRDCEALLRARFGRLAAALPDTEPLSVEARENLVRAFLADPAGAPYAHDPSAWFLIDALVDFRCDYHGRDPLRWSGGVVLLFLLDFVPRKLSAAYDTLARVPAVLRAWVPWAAARAGLPPELAGETVGTIDEIEPGFLEALTDERRWGPAKRMAMRMLAAGVDPSDGDAANAWLAGQIPA